jgi:NAD(P)-dependent dehydrogenase (short-subunit alcohol dehydrogenase family)
MNILITGGASGLGEAITRKLAKNKENTIYFTYSKSDEKARKLTSKLTNTISVKCDFKNEEDLERLLSDIPKFNLDVLVNNAYTGSFLTTYFHKIDLINFENEFLNDVIPTIRITQSVISEFRKKKSGKIITVLTSALLNTPPIGSSIYLANKSCLEEMTKVWAIENGRFNITSNSISPSMMETGITQSIDERIIDQLKGNHPLKRFVSTDEVADSIDYLTTVSTHMNGVNIVINSAVNIS